MQKFTQDLKKFGTTLSLATAGTLVAGPIGLIAGGAVGGAIDFWRARKAKPAVTYTATPAEVAKQVAIATQMTAAGQSPPLALSPMMVGSRAAARQAAALSVPAPATVAGESTSIKG